MKKNLQLTCSKRFLKESTFLLFLLFSILLISSCKSEKEDSITPTAVTMMTPSPTILSQEKVDNRTPSPTAISQKPTHGYTITQGKIIMEKHVQDYTVKIDLTDQILSLWTPEEIILRKGDTIPLYSDLKELVRYNKFLSAAIISARAKQFDDGLYAAVNIAVQEGTDKLQSKKIFLSGIYKALKELQDGEDKDLSRAFILTAMELGGEKVNDDKKIIHMAEKMKEDFLKDQLSSKPLGFYTWNNELTQIFQQDRFLKSRITKRPPPLFPLTNPLPLAQAVIRSGGQDTYVKYLKLNEKLTNPFPAGISDFRTLFSKMAHGLEDVFIFFPPSRSVETDYMKTLNYPLTDAFNLSDKLIEEIKTGKLNINPEENSGWYDYQIYSLEPLILPDKFPETKKVEFTENYKKRLVNLCKSLWATMRETHYEQGETGETGCTGEAGPTVPVIYIEPELSLEPLVTYYLRRADSYKFIHRALLDTFGQEGLKKMHRYTFSGPVEKNLDDELTDMEKLFIGSALLSAQELGYKIDSNSSNPLDKNNVEFIRKFIDNMDKDPDLSGDNRMMVPLFYEPEVGKTKVWLFLGYEKTTLSVSFKNRPAVNVFDKTGKKLDKNKVDIVYTDCYKDLVYPVFEEIFVKKLLNREEFQKLCDKYKTRAEILEALKNL